MWAGLRGAVGLSLSLYVLLDNSIEDLRYRTLTFFFVGMMVRGGEFWCFRLCLVLSSAW